MKKFLLLLVGVLFALSANAWTFYVDVAKTGWSSTSTPYLYAGEWNSTANNNTGAIQYHVKKQGTLVSGSIYKFDFTYGNNFDRFIISTKGEFEVNNGGDLSSEVDKENTYGVFFKNNGYNANFKFNDKCFLVLHAPNTDGGADYYETTYQIRGDLNGADKWSSEALTFTIQDGKFICDASTYKSLSGSFKVYDIKNDRWYGGNFNSVDPQISLSTSGDKISISAISNPVFELVNDNGLKLTISEKGSTDPDPGVLTIGFAGNFSNEKGIWWLKPTDDNAPKFTRQSGDIYVLDLGKLGSQWDFNAGTEFKIYNITGDLASAQKGWGRGYGVKSGELYAGVPYTMAQSDTETSNIKVAEAITSPYLTLDVSTWTITVSSGSGAIVVPDYVYEISGTFNGWQPPVGTASEKRPYQLTRKEADGKVTYEITIPGTMKAGAEFKICNMSISDDAWGAAYGTTYTTTNTVATRDELTPGTAYQMRRTNVPGENIIIKETVVDPKFVLDPITMKVTVVSTYVAPKDFAYWLYGTMYDGNWNPYKLNQQPDGTWTATFDVRSNAQFGIRITEYSDESGNSQIDGGSAKGWIYCADGQADHAVVDNHYVINIGQPTKCVVKDGNAGKDFVTASGNDTPFSGTTQLTVVFDPKNMTIVFYNPATLQATITQIAEGTANYEDLGQAVNSISLDVDLTNYSYPVAASYSLAVGNTVLATATTAVNKVTFNDLPYYSSMELSLIPAGTTTGVPLNVTAPALNSNEMFNLSVNKLLFVTDADDTTGDLVLTCTSTGSLVYNKPAIVATWGDYEFDTTVEWSKDGFTAVVKDVVPTSNGVATEARKITVTFNPIFPFAVTNATNLSGASLLADSTHYLAEFGGPREIWTVTTDAGLTVSGVEGVAVENEEAPVEYYNLQGQRVNGELAPGIYIRRQGNTVTKVRI